MNLILFEPTELDRPLPTSDPRAIHLREILRCSRAQTFDCGLVDGPRGRARIEREDAAGLTLSFAWEASPPPTLPRVWLLVGLPRPQTARKILQECTALGVSGFCFFPTDKGEPSYASSQLWRTGEVRRHLLAGAAQAFCTHLPACDVAPSLEQAVAHATACPTRIALDNYEAPQALAGLAPDGLPAALALGSERGWSSRERDQLRARGFVLAHLGRRVLRTETAAVAGLALLHARLGTIS